MEHYTKASTSDAVSEREEKGRELSYRAACESIVLLKNDGALPFRGKRLALFGAGASHTVKGGTGSGEVNERRSVSVTEALTERGVSITTKDWLRDYDAKYDKALEKYKKGSLSVKQLTDPINALLSGFRMPAGRAVTKNDITYSGTENCVYVLSRQAGEGGDRKLEKGDYLLTDAEIADIKFCAFNYKHFVLVINAGSGVDMSFADDIEGINAILFISQLGSEGGYAVADVLYGTVNPSGKLADTWAKSYSDIPFGNEFGSLDGDVENDFYKEGIYVGYRYFDSFGVEPRYPFGFGLSYTDFKQSRAKLSAEGTKITASVTVKNTGLCRAGRETVQLYVSAPAGSIDKEFQRLAAFKKTGLIPPKKSETVTLSFDLRSLASFRSEDGAFVLEKGDYTVRVGSSSRDTVPAAVLRLEADAVVSRHEHVCPRVRSFNELSAGGTESGNPLRLPVLRFDAESIKTVVHSYETPEIMRDSRVRPFVDKLSTEEMAKLLVGAGRGDRRFDLPGAVGSTSSEFWEKGLVNTAMCDGPAGLRISRRAAQTAEGEIKPLEMVFSFMETLPGFVKKRMLGDEAHDTVLYQFATAFPTESALAQSWNEELLYEIGCAVRAEMEEYGCTWWLAPAINIHRNPLCGRNFEYFSEDPVLAGKLSAALVRGVQSKKGTYAVIKHFACNNREDGRNDMNSHVSERALREIYLRAFEISVREGGAKSVMTSYNRLNGVYTANSYDLCTRVLRNEWGFEGVVMTDWYSTSSVKDGAALAISAGNDLIMPGEPMGLSVKNIVKGVKRGTVTFAQLKRCCCRVVKAVMESEIQKEYVKEEKSE